MSNTGYHWFVIIITLGIGVILAFFKPYWAFLFAIFIGIAFSFLKLKYTRLPGVGAYFNMNDVCILIAILAFLRDESKPLMWPAPVIAMLAILIIGFVNTGFQIGISYYTMRAFRWAITIPLLFMITANMVTVDRAKALLLVIVLGGIVASIQHIAYSLVSIGRGNPIEQIRFYDFALKRQYVFPIIGLMTIRGRATLRPLQIIVGMLFLTSLVLTQTRSMLLGFAGGGTDL